MSTEQRANLQRRSPAAVSLSRQKRRQRTAATTPGADIGAAGARRSDGDRRRTGRSPDRRGHRGRNRAGFKPTLLSIASSTTGRRRRFSEGEGLEVRPGWCGRRSQAAFWSHRRDSPLAEDKGLASPRRPGRRSLRFAAMPFTSSSPPETVRSGYLDPGAPPVATSGRAMLSATRTLDALGQRGDLGMTFAEREPLRHRYPNGPYSMMGPVEVTGAEPGDTVECRLLTLRTRDWGWNSFPLGVGALPHDFAKPYVHYFRFNAERTSTEYVQGITLPLAPFLGVMAVEPAGNDPVSAILAGPYGGNLVLRELTVGSSL